MFFWIILTLIFAQTLYHLIIHPKKVLIVIKTFPRDITIGLRFLKLRLVLRWYRFRNYTVSHIFEQNVENTPSRICFYYKDQAWTYQEVENLANQFGTFFSSQGYGNGDVVSLFMTNCPQYVCAWLGLNKIGVVVALINTNLRLQPLYHCISASKSKGIIYGVELSEAIHDLINSSNLGSELCFYSFGEPSVGAHINLQHTLKSVPISKPIPKIPLSFDDKCLLVYTSGTTGLPKPAIIKHGRFMFLSLAVSYVQSLYKSDVVYVPVPLYHSQGGIIGVGQALLYGIPVVIVPKFSASRFWKDCIQYKATVTQYLGELCRFLLSRPPSPEDKKHSVRLMFGNGMRKEIWNNFLERFNNPIIAEVYGSTEGNCGLANYEGHSGAVGFIPILARNFLHQNLIKVNPSTGEPLRDPKTGYVIECGEYEPGEVIGKIIMNDPMREFEGYTDSNANDCKIIKDVFKKGDIYFRSGDVLEYDEYGYYYFKDRTGDTFRWRGENVSTTEVEGILSKICQLKNAIDFGVEVPFNEGKAGMAVIADPEKTLDLDALCQGILKQLPSYARPLFLRVMESISVTGTYKLQKQELQKEGFDIKRISSDEQLYFFQNDKFIRLDEHLYNQIMDGKIRL